MPIASFRDIAQELSTKYDEREKKLPKIRGEVVEVRQSTGADSVFVEGRPGYVWVRIFDTDGGVMPILCRLANPIVEMPVTISNMPGSTMLEIISFDDEIARADADYDGLPYLRPHHKEHEMPDGAPGIDAMTVYPRSLSELKTYQTNPTSLSVNVSQLRYLYEGTSTVFNGAAIDLTASVPAAGQARLVLVYLDPSTNTLALTNGAVGPIGAAWALPEPAHTDGAIDSAVVRLENGQTVIIETDIRDRRQIINAGALGHDVFSATHPDAITDAVAKGDIPVGNATPQLEPLTVGGTAGYRLVVDAAQGQGMRWGPDFLWPWNDRILLRDNSAANTEYATLAAAIAASATGDTIFVPPGSWACEGLTLPDGVNIVGLDRDLTRLVSLASAITLTLGNGCYVYNVKIRNSWSSAAFIAAVRAPDTGFATLQDCEISCVNTRAIGLDPAYGTYFDPTYNGRIILVDTNITTATASAAGWSLAAYVSQAARLEIHGGRLDAGTVGATIFDAYTANVAGAIIDLYGVVSVRGLIGTAGANGIVRGWRYDRANNLWQVGTETDYSEFEADGTLEFLGDATVWNDVYFPMSSGKIGGANQPTWAAFQGNTFEYTFAINDYIHLPSGEIPHSYLEGSDITLHAHIVLDGSDAANRHVRYELEYTIGDMGEVMSAAAVVTSGDFLIPGLTADRTHFYVPIGTIAGATYLIGAALKMRFRRIATIGGVAPTNDPFVLMAGAHVEEDTVGSRQELAK